MWSDDYIMGRMEYHVNSLYTDKQDEFIKLPILSLFNKQFINSVNTTKVSLMISP